MPYRQIFESELPQVTSITDSSTRQASIYSWISVAHCDFRLLSRSQICSLTTGVDSLAAKFGEQQECRATLLQSFAAMSFFWLNSFASKTLLVSSLFVRLCREKHAKP